MRLSLILFWVFMWGLNSGSLAREFEVRSFEADPSDLAARRNPRTTVNDEPAALIKVVTNIEGMMFDSNLGIVDYEHREAEYWLYVPPRERRIRLMAPYFLAKDVSLPESAQEATVYHLVVAAKKPATDANFIPVNILVEGHNDYLLFANREEFPASQTISFPRGNNSIRIEKQGYQSINTEIEVDEMR